MIYLDTHVVVWMYAGLVEKFSFKAKQLINAHELRISPMVLLELQYLKEVGKIRENPSTVIDDLKDRVGLEICSLPFESIALAAQKIVWTRDPFDRIIAAHVALEDSTLLTKDDHILKNFSKASW